MNRITWLRGWIRLARRSEPALACLIRRSTRPLDESPD